MHAEPTGDATVKVLDNAFDKWVIVDSTACVSAGPRANVIVRASTLALQVS